MVTNTPIRSAEFASNFNGWVNETSYLTNDIYSNKHFDDIVSMKEDAVPFIIEELKKGPTPLVHALDCIYPGRVKYDGYVPLNIVCNIWLNLLSKTEKL